MSYPDWFGLADEPDPHEPPRLTPEQIAAEEARLTLAAEQRAERQDAELRQRSAAHAEALRAKLGRPAARRVAPPDRPPVSMYAPSGQGREARVYDPADDE